MKDNKEYHHPAHYFHSRLQPWDVVKAWGLNFFEGNVVKYICRCASGNTAKKHSTAKGVLTDLCKAREYLDEIIRQAERAVEDDGKQQEATDHGQLEQCGDAPIRQ